MFKPIGEVAEGSKTATARAADLAKAEAMGEAKGRAEVLGDLVKEVRTQMADKLTAAEARAASAEARAASAEARATELQVENAVLKVQTPQKIVDTCTIDDSGD